MRPPSGKDDLWLQESPAIGSPDQFPDESNDDQTSDKLFVGGMNGAA